MLALALQAVPATPCTYDRPAMLALDEQAFDQDMAGGWRAVSAAPGCGVAAADLIRDWRVAHSTLRDPGILYWHEAQLRAVAGNYAAAVPRMERSRKPATDDAFG